MFPAVPRPPDARGLRVRSTISISAFTLIELLVVITIIAVLAAILFPILAQTRAKSRQTACLSNMRQMALGWLQYTQDYSGGSIMGRTGGPGTPAFAWHSLILPYVKSAGVYVCPEDKRSGSPLANGGPDVLSYAYNFGVGQDVVGQPRAVPSMAAPALTPIFADAVGTNDPAESLFFIVPAQANTTPTPGSKIEMGRAARAGNRTMVDTVRGLIAPDRHASGANYAFVDGHANWYHYEEGVQLDGSMKDRAQFPTTRGPAKKGLDYNGDGVVGDDPHASPPTTGNYH